MGSAHFGDVHYVGSRVGRTAKFLVTGAFGVGKTTLIGSVSEITPLRSKALMTQASVGVDDTALTPGKTTTTVGLDFGRRHLNDHLVLYLFGTPGQRRLWSLWAGLSHGALGALVLVDTRRLADSFEVLDQLELTNPQLPFTVTVNRFPDTPDHALHEVRKALALPRHTPITELDARDRSSCVRGLITLTSHALDHSPSLHDRAVF